MWYDADCCILSSKIYRLIVKCVCAAVDGFYTLITHTEKNNNFYESDSKLNGANDNRTVNFLPFSILMFNSIELQSC